MLSRLILYCFTLPIAAFFLTFCRFSFSNIQHISKKADDESAFCFFLLTVYAEVLSVSEKRRCLFRKIRADYKEKAILPEKRKLSLEKSAEKW